MLQLLFSNITFCGEHSKDYLLGEWEADILALTEMRVLPEAVQAVTKRFRYQGKKRLTVQPAQRTAATGAMASSGGICLATLLHFVRRSLVQVVASLWRRLRTTSSC